MPMTPTPAVAVLVRSHASHADSRRILASVLKAAVARRVTNQAVLAVLLLFLLAGHAIAQTASLSVGTASGSPGASVDLSVSFSAGSTTVSGFLFDLGFPSSLSYGSVTTGSAASAAGKGASANSISGGVRVLIFGVNQTAIGSGPVAIVHLNIAAGAAAGTIAVNIGNISASDPSGNPVTVSGSGGSVTVLGGGGGGAPTIAITSPTSSGSYTTTSSTLSISGTASVGVTQVTWTNNRGGSGTASGTTSWSVSGIALQSGSNVITLTARDAAGKSGTALITVTYNSGPDTTPPVVSAVSTSLTSTTATISWTTNESATSQVDYGTTSAYGSATAADPTLVTSHSQTLTGLTPETNYHFRVKSTDAAGNLAASADYTFKTNATDGAVKLFLYYPSMSSQRRKAQNAAQLDDEYTSVALTNLDTGEATLTFTAYDVNGVQISGTGIANPVTKTLAPGQQMPLIDYQLFGDAIMNSDTQGWIQVGSSTMKLAGFFMTFDNELTYLDGADIPSTLPGTFVLPEISGQDFTEIQLTNPNSAAASVRLDLMKSDGSLQATSQQTIEAGGTVSADVFADLFPGVAADPGSYLRVSASQGLLGYETTGRDSKDLTILAGQDAGGGASRLYSPQYAIGGPWRSTLSVVNLDGTDGTLALKLISDLGMQIGATKFVNIAGGGKVYISDQAFFGDLIAGNPGQIIQGYVEVTGLGLHLAGSVVFGDAQNGVFSSALPLVSTLQNSIIFSHVASNDQYYTGLAILNPNTVSAKATIDLYRSDGHLEASVTQSIPAGQRIARLLTEYFPVLVGQDWTSGYFRVTVDQGVACFALFGTTDYSVLSAIPAQPVP